jgi:hypothetical protein
MTKGIPAILLFATLKRHALSAGGKLRLSGYVDEARQKIRGIARI